MNPTGRILVALLVVATSAALLGYQREESPPVLLGGIELRIGMAQEDALRRLSATYDVVHHDAFPGLWSVVRKGGTPYQFIGTVSFQDHRLTIVNKFWGPSWPATQSAKALAEALQAAVDQIPERDRQACRLVTQDFRQKGAQTVIFCGHRQLSVFADRDGKGESGVTETIGID